MLRYENECMYSKSHNTRETSTGVNVMILKCFRRKKWAILTQSTAFRFQSVGFREKKTPTFLAEKLIIT
jgi:hypothetical protein